MIVKKIITGYVNQIFNTETGKYTDQEFIAGDQVEYENAYTGEALDDDAMPTPEPYLPMNMVQPADML